MSSVLGSFTALPNLHPALVHFPVALAITALLFDLISILLPRRTWWERSAAALYALAAAGAVAAYLAGRQAANGLGAISAQAETVLARHADLALWTVAVLLVAALFRVAANIRDAGRPAARFGALRAIALITLAGGSALVGATADLGGALVFRHGVAVTRPQTGAAPAAPSIAVTTTPATPLFRGADGSITWSPSSGDTAALGRILVRAPAGGTGTVEAVTGRGDGLGLKVNGESLLTVPGTFGDLSAEVRLDLSRFDGTAGLAHHVAADGSAVILSVSTSGRAQLFRRSAGRQKLFGAASISAPSGLVILRTTAAGHHMKGFIDGKLAVHGHGSAGQPGRVGVYLNGRGTVRLLRLEVHPAVSHLSSGEQRGESYVPRMSVRSFGHHNQPDVTDAPSSASLQTAINLGGLT